MTKRARADMIEASLVVLSACLNKSIVECMELHHLLAEAQGQKEKDHVGVRVALGEFKARGTKAMKVLGKVEARGAKVDARIIEAEVKARVVEEALGKVRDQAFAVEEEA